MPTYKILSLTPMTGKTGMAVVFTDAVNGKPPVTQYHEVESTDDAVIAEQLSAAAIEYESRVAPVVTASKLKLNTAVTAVAKVEKTPVDAQIVK